LKRAENTLGIRKDCKIDLLRDAVSEGDLLVVEIPYSDITSIFKTNAIRIMKIFLKYNILHKGTEYFQLYYLQSGKLWFQQSKQESYCNYNNHLHCGHNSLAYLEI